MTRTIEPHLAAPRVLGAYAGFASRAVALIIDLAIDALLLTIISVTIRLLQEAVRYSELTVALLSWLQITMSLSLLVGYFIFGWMLAGQTVGMALMGVRVVRTNGQYVTLWVAVRRLVGMLLSSILFLGYLWVLIDDRRQGLHDKLAGTYVIYAWSGPRIAGGTKFRRLRRSRRSTDRAES
jgi:uncharacterized RDD family membrane protein YckC